MATDRDTHALDAAVRRARSPRLVRWARSPLKLARLKRMNATTAVRARLFWGDTMLVTPPEPLSLELFLYGFHELGMTRFMLERVRPGMTVLDVGAHYGYYTMLASHLVGPSGSVHAFEPVPSTGELLTRNVAGRGNVVVNAVAAWNSAAEIEIRDLGRRRSMFNSVFSPGGSGGTGESVSVRALRLDEYVVTNRLAPGFVKIDTESAEPYVIAGLADTLRTYRPTLTVELGDEAPGLAPWSRNLLEMICGEYGYEPFEFSSGRIRPHTLREHYDAENVALVAKPNRTT